MKDQAGGGTCLPGCARSQTGRWISASGTAPPSPLFWPCHTSFRPPPVQSPTNRDLIEASLFYLMLTANAHALAYTILHMHDHARKGPWRFHPSHGCLSHGGPRAAAIFGCVLPKNRTNPAHLDRREHGRNLPYLPTEGCGGLSYVLVFDVLPRLPLDDLPSVMP